MTYWLLLCAFVLWTVANAGLSYCLLVRIHAWGIRRSQLDDEAALYRQQLTLEVDSLVKEVVADPTHPKWRSLVHPRLH